MTLYAERKAEHVALARKHFAADMLVKGTYGEGAGTEFRGCSVGCLRHDIDCDDSGNKHADLAEYFLYPEWMLRLQDTIFEGLPSPEHLQWHVTIAETLETLPEDYDWQAAFHRVMSGILHVALPHAGTSTEVVQCVIGLHDRAARGGTVTSEEWAADAVARWAAAGVAAVVARWAAADAADAAARWAAADVAGAYFQIRDAIIEALKVQKVKP
jgi:hypothetical protein